MHSNSDSNGRGINALQACSDVYWLYGIDFDYCNHSLCIDSTPSDSALSYQNFHQGFLAPGISIAI